MKLPESAIGTAKAFGWKTYSVRRRDKEPLLGFIVEALEGRGCKIISVSSPSLAPFYIVYENASGLRRGLLAYAFFANSKQTLHRPDDEHRFQIKYGSGLKGILEVAVDPSALVTTIFLGIDTIRQVFVAADPLMHNPSPMSRSLEFKSAMVQEIMKSGWVAWERDRHVPKTNTRPTPSFDEDFRTEIIIGGKKNHLVDLIELEQIALGLTPASGISLLKRLLKTALNVSAIFLTNC